MPNNALLLFDSEAALHRAIEQGAYSPRFIPPEDGPRWRRGHRGAAADLATLQAGGLAFLFANRGIYGIGKLADPPVVLNHPNALVSDPGENDGVLAGTRLPEHRLVVRFDHHDSTWFEDPVDMDDVLTTGGDAMYALRTMENVSLAVFDEQEARAFEQELWLKNAHAVPRPGGQPPTGHEFSVVALNSEVADSDERALETDLAYRLNRREDLPAFAGPWRSALRQVAASPAKPVTYVDRIDLLARDLDPTGRFVRRHGVIELKTGTATKRHAEQLMRYVDWVADRYHQGRYDRVRAYLVAEDFGARLRSDLRDVAPRYYTVDPRRPRARRWNELRLVRASRDANTGGYRYEVTHDVTEEADG